MIKKSCLVPDLNCRDKVYFIDYLYLQRGNRMECVAGRCHGNIVTICTHCYYICTLNIPVLSRNFFNLWPCKNLVTWHIPTNQSTVFWSRDTYLPIGAQYSGHVTHTNQSEHSNLVTWHIPTNRSTVFWSRDTYQPIGAQYSGHVTHTNQSEHSTLVSWHIPTNQSTVFWSRDTYQPIGAQ